MIGADPADKVVILRDGGGEADLPRLLMVVDDHVAGGAYAVGERLGEALTDAYQVLFACDFSPANRASREALAKAGVRVLRLCAHAGEPRRAICDRQGARALLKRARPDRILFVDSSTRSSIALKDMALEYGLPYVCQINLVDRATPPALKRWDADVIRAAGGALCNMFVSAAARRDFETNFPAVTAPGLVVPNGIPDVFFRCPDEAARGRLRRELGVGDAEVLLLLPGRLERRKGQHAALDAMARLAARDGPGLRLVLAGYGEAWDRQALARQIDRLGIAGSALYLGPRRDVPQLLDACDLVLMPSQHEADPLVSKEAMAKGRPVVASDLAGVREQGHDEALLVPPPEGDAGGTVEALVTVIDDLRRDPVRRTRIGHELKTIAQERFTMAQMVETYVRILSDMPAPAPARVEDAPPPLIGRWLHPSDPWQITALKDGWSDVERDGIWSVGDSARIAFALEVPSRDVVVRLKVKAFAARGYQRRFEVLANGSVVDVWSFEKRRPGEKTIRIRLAAPRRRFVIRFRSEGAKSPFELGAGDDRRRLGLFLSALRIDAGLPEPEGIAGRLTDVAAVWRERGARWLRRVASLTGLPTAPPAP